MGPDGFSVTAAPFGAECRIFITEGTDFRPWTAQTSVLRPAELLPQPRKFQAGIARATLLDGKNRLLPLIEPLQFRPRLE